MDKTPTKLPILSDREVIRVLKKAGFIYAPKRGKGSHIAMFNPQTRRLVIIPKTDQIPRGTLLSIIKQAGLTKEEFLKLLKS
jgi:predicted RNA binding protein YcfA (HicA-like mRNA interferase family)